MSDGKEKPQGSKKGPNVKPTSKGSFNLGTTERRHKPLRRSRSNEAENRRREGSRGRERDRKESVKQQRGRSEEGRRRDRDHEPGHDKTEQPKDDLEDTECIVCFCSFDNVFKTPKLLSCGHTFCLECLARINVNSPEVKMLICPICRELTVIRHGRDLPHLGNNEEIFRKLPADMQRALSVRFKRSQGKLILKNPTPNSFIKTSLHLPVLKKKEEQAGNPLGVMEEGLGQATMIDVGRPPSRMRGRMRRLMYSNQCYYAVLGAIIVITVALMLIGIFTFVVMPFMHKPVTPIQNLTTPSQSP
ncbi:E3 ubiquitin-protein ligase RNF183 [Pimephales promelas]|uniref:E3 ubiquitin-protein ligase RNF183 n=1 Tax=Pimephales promelas TaxID=90988 RepID=UPI0019556B29|nr:E3 ubiquitin-protein ligase RNF183 [Pimephales promelas]KAG1952229.1 E3 ubiquitin-protein ligase RNF183 [Pimephales promelas]KAG1952230.1 E3 ubiquitin-protein ligase RNF183 [Pimephales promelas]